MNKQPKREISGMALYQQQMENARRQQQVSGGELPRTAKALKPFTPLILLLAMTGCASLGDQSAGGGSAVYHYERTESDGAHTVVTITSGRDVGEASIEVTPDGWLTANAKRLDGSAVSAKALDAANTALGIIKQRESK